MCWKNVKNITCHICRYHLSDAFFQDLNAPKLVFGRRSDPDHVGGAYDAPPTPVGGEEDNPRPLSIPFPLDAFGISILRPPVNKIPGSAYAVKLS